MIHPRATGRRVLSPRFLRQAITSDGYCHPVPPGREPRRVSNWIQPRIGSSNAPLVSPLLGYSFVMRPRTSSHGIVLSRVMLGPPAAGFYIRNGLVGV